MDLHVHLGSRFYRIFLSLTSSTRVVAVFPWWHQWKDGTNSPLYGPIKWSIEFVPSTSCRLHRFPWWQVVILLDLLVLFSKGNVLPSEVLHLLGILLFHGIHLPLQGDDQGMIVIHLTWYLQYYCWAPIFRGSYGEHAKQVGCMP